MQVQHLFLGLLKASPQQRLLGTGGFVGSRDRRADIVDFLIDQAIDLVNLTAQLHHRRVGRLIDAQVILVLRIQLGLGFLERLDRAALKDLAGPLSASRIHLSVDCLGGDPLLFGVTQGLIDACQGLTGNTLLVVGIDDAGFTGETHQLPLGILQLDLDLLQALLQKIARIGRGVETAFQVQVDITLRHGIDDISCLFRIRAVVVQLDQPRIAHRFDGQVLQESADDAFEARALRGRFRLFIITLRQPVGHPLLELREQRGFLIGLTPLSQPQLVDDPQRQAPTFEQFVLGLVIILTRASALDRGYLFDLGNFDVFAINLHRGAGTIDGRFQKGRSHHGSHHDQGKQDDGPAALDDDMP